MKRQKMNKNNSENLTVGQYLVNRLHDAGVDDMFAVPGDYVLGFLNCVIQSGFINYIGTCNELNAAYAADAYARLKGIGCVCTTYSVGELSAINGIAGGFAENVPIVSIVGCPSTSDYKSAYLLHHTLGNYSLTKDIYSKITTKAVFINNPSTALHLIDEALNACLLSKLPVYIGICSDIVSAECKEPISKFILPKMKFSDLNTLDEAINELLNRLNDSKLPILIPGIELRRFKLEKKFAELVEKSGLPVATMMLGKTIINESNPQFIGLYSGNRSREYVRNRVEKSDCILVFGEKLTDFNTGGFSAQLLPSNTINISRDNVRISHHIYNNVYIHDVLEKIIERVQKRDASTLDIHSAMNGCIHSRYKGYEPKLNEKLTMDRLFDRFASFIPENSIVIAETGASLFSAAETLMPEGTIFIGQTFYGSVGYTIGACLGACIAMKDKLVILFIGDGSFQFTCQDLSTMLRNNCKPIIVLINNDGYTIERVIVDNKFNDIARWNYCKLLEVFGGNSMSFYVETEGDLENALNDISDTKNSTKLSFIEVILGKFDCSRSLKLAGKSMAKKNRLIPDVED